MKKKTEFHPPGVVQAIFEANIDAAPKSALRGAVKAMLPDFHNGAHRPLSYQNLLECDAYPCRMFSKSNAYE